MRRVRLERPFVSGMVTDVPAHLIGPQHSAFAQDGYSPQGIYRQRGGWAFDGTVADVADNLVGVYRAMFALADVTRTLTVDDDGDFFIHNTAGAGTSLALGAVAHLPRCVYKDQLVFCATDGQTPLSLYSGGPQLGRAFASGSPQFTLDKATLSGTNTFTPNTPTPGEYATPTFGVVRIELAHRILEVTGDDSVTLEDVQSSSTTALSSVSVTPFGVTYPCVSVYSAGTVAISGGTATGTGTKWSTGDWDAVQANLDSILPLTLLTGGTDYRNFHADVVTNDTTMTVNAGTVAESAYHILRRCPFKDAAAHRESLWGTGVAQYPNRVYVSPPGWNPALPPGFSLPFDAANEHDTPNPNDFLLDFIDVPSPYDGDHNVALLPSPNQLWVLKREKAYGIYGSFGGLEVSRDPIGPGCIDIRSAIAVAEGAFWASEDDVYWAAGNAAEPLMAGKIAREWRELTNDFDFGVSDYVTCGVAAGYLVVHITTGGGTTQRTYLCDLRDQSWQCRVSNFTPRFMFSSRIPDEVERVLAVSNAHQGRVLDFAPAVDGSGTAKDDGGTGPRMQAHTSTALARANGVEGLNRLFDVDLHTNVHDVGAAGSTAMDVSLVTGGGISDEADVTTALGTINSDTADRIDRHHFRPAKRGRFQQVRVDVDTTGTDDTATKAEIAQIDLSVKDSRGRAR